MSAVDVMPGTRLIRGDDLVPSRLAQVLRQIKVDKFTGNVMLNVRDGRIMGFHKTEIVTLTAAEI